MDLGVLHKHLRIVREGDRLFIPTTTRVDLDFPTEQREFGEGFVAIRSYKDVVDVPESLRRSLPSSFDVIGDIAVLKVPSEMQRYRGQIGRAILRSNATLRVVVADRGRKWAPAASTGSRRTRAMPTTSWSRSGPSTASSSVCRTRRSTTWATRSRLSGRAAWSTSIESWNGPTSVPRRTAFEPSPHRLDW